MVYNFLFCRITAAALSLEGPARRDKKVIHHALKSVTTPCGVYLTLDNSAFKLLFGFAYIRNDARLLSRFYRFEMCIG
jgi:hypothetical protein